MDRLSAGFEEQEHTADWELLVWAPDLTGLFVQAARGMYHLMGAQFQTSPPVRRILELDAWDRETLLVTFLSELLFLGEQEGLGFDHFNLTIQDLHLTGQIEGFLIESQDKEIKAVTFHNLHLRQTPDGFSINIVFDV